MGSGASKEKKGKKSFGEEINEDNEGQSGNFRQDEDVSPDHSEYNPGGDKLDTSKDKNKGLDNLLSNILVSPQKKASSFKMDTSKLMPSQIWVRIPKPGFTKIQL